MKIIKYADGASSRPLEKWVVVNNEQVFKEGPVKIVAGGIAAADEAADPVYGLCRGFIADGGSTPLEKALPGQFDGTLVDGVSYTASADNQTDKKVQALVEPILVGDIIRAEADDALGTTTGSDEVGYLMSVLTTDERELDESSASTSAGQFIIVGQPGKENFVDVKLVKNQLNG